MADVRITQPQAASLTYVDDWADRLSDAYPAAPVTISSAVGSATGGAVVTQVAGSGTSITFHLATSSCTPSHDIVVTLTATLSNGDSDPRSLTVGVTQT